MDKKDNNDFAQTRKSNQESFDKRLILRIVKLIEEGLPRKEAMATYGMSNSAVLEWMRKYGSPEYQNRKQLRLPLSEKRTIIRAIVQGHMTIGEAMIANNIKTSGIVRRWVNDYKKEIGEFRPKSETMKIMNSGSSDEVIQLNKALALSRLRVQALDTMIDIAEEDFNISIRKKCGARQS